MSEKQFQIIHLGNPYEFVVKDNTTNKTYGPFEGDEKSMSDLLNEQAERIRKQSIRIYCQDKEIQRLLGELEKIPKSIREVWIEE